MVSAVSRGWALCPGAAPRLLQLASTPQLPVLPQMPDGARAATEWPEVEEGAGVGRRDWSPPAWSGGAARGGGLPRSDQRLPGKGGKCDPSPHV